MRQFDYHQHQNTLWCSSIASYVLALAAMLLTAWGMGSAIRGEKVHATTAMSLALLTGSAGLVTRRIVDSTAPIMGDFRDVGDDVRQNAMYQEVSGWTPNTSEQLGVPSNNPTAKPSLMPVEWFDWNEIVNQPDDFPHLAFVAKTGGGKSTIAEWMAGKLGGIVLAAAPHYKPGDFQTADIIVCQGRNYGTDAREYRITEDKRGNEVIEGEYPVSFQEILTGAEPTYAQLMQSLIQEMTYRYRLRQNGELSIGDNIEQGELPRINVILDEYNAVARIKGFKECLAPLLREARKVGIRLFLLIQSDQVKSLGIEGEGDIRLNLSYVRMANSAKNYLRGKVLGMRQNHPDLNEWNELFSELSQSKRPCMVEDKPALVPDLSPGSDAWSYDNGDDSAVTIPQASTYSYTASIPVPDSVQESNNTGHSLDDDRPVNDQQSITTEQLQIVLNLRNMGMSKTQIVTKVLGCSGRKYAPMVEVLEEMGVTWD